jgi:outer membrane protein OmpA-like peptidoglycan-associated protein
LATSPAATASAGAAPLDNGSVAAPPATASRSVPPSAPATAAPLAIPETVPQTAMITPIAPPPAAAPPPPPPVSDKAATNAAPTSSGLRITFAAGQSDLSPESVASIRQFATAAPAGDTANFNVMAYAPGSSDDPSTARRISLSRAMAVRSALVADGVSSARIYVRAMGAQYGEGPPDRVDVNVLGTNDPGPVAAQAAPR